MAYTPMGPDKDTKYVLPTLLNEQIISRSLIRYRGKSPSGIGDVKIGPIPDVSKAMAAVTDPARDHGMKSGQIAKAISRAAPQHAVKTMSPGEPCNAACYQGLTPKPMAKQKPPKMMKPKMMKKPRR